MTAKTSETSGPPAQFPRFAAHFLKFPGQRSALPRRGVQGQNRHRTLRLPREPPAAPRRNRDSRSFRSATRRAAAYSISHMDASVARSLRFVGRPRPVAPCRTTPPRSPHDVAGIDPRYRALQRPPPQHLRQPPPHGVGAVDVFAPAVGGVEQLVPPRPRHSAPGGCRSSIRATSAAEDSRMPSPPTGAPRNSAAPRLRCRAQWRRWTWRRNRSARRTPFQPAGRFPPPPLGARLAVAHLHPRAGRHQGRWTAPPVFADGSAASIPPARHAAPADLPGSTTPRSCRLPVPASPVRPRRDGVARPRRTPDVLLPP